MIFFFHAVMLLCCSYCWSKHGESICVLLVCRLYLELGSVVYSEVLVGLLLLLQGEICTYACMIAEAEPYQYTNNGNEERDRCSYVV